jgi:metal-sulfur cluster biosynthetic enzyme
VTNSGPASVESRVRAALDTVRDPCSEVAGVPAGILEMGLVRSLDVHDGPDGALVRVAIGVTEPTCLMGPSFVSGARERLAAVPGVARVEVTLSSDPDWSPLDMSPDYRARLAEHRRTRRGSIAVVETPMGGAIRVRSRDEEAS